jgi:hypothetical protein
MVFFVLFLIAIVWNWSIPYSHGKIRKYHIVCIIDIDIIDFETEFINYLIQSDLPISCGNSWHSTAIDVLIPPVILLAKATPIARPSLKLNCSNGVVFLDFRTVLMVWYF